MSATEKLQWSTRWRAEEGAGWSSRQELTGRQGPVEWSANQRLRSGEYPWFAHTSVAASCRLGSGTLWAGDLALQLGAGGLAGRAGSFGLTPGALRDHATLALGSGSTWRPEWRGIGWTGTRGRFHMGGLLSRTSRDASADGQGFVLDLVQDESPSRRARIGSFRDDQLALWLGSKGPRLGWEFQSLARRLPERSTHSRTGWALGLRHRQGAWTPRAMIVRGDHRLVWVQSRFSPRRKPRLALDFWRGERGSRQDFAQPPVPLPRVGSGSGMAVALSVPMQGAWQGYVFSVEEQRQQERDSPLDALNWSSEWGLRLQRRKQGQSQALSISSISGGIRYALQFQRDLGARLSVNGSLKLAGNPGASARSSFFQIRVGQEWGEWRLHALLREEGATRLGQLFFPVPGIPQLESGSGDSDRIGLGFLRNAGVGRTGHGRIAVTLERVIRFREKRVGVYTVQEIRDRWKMALNWSWFLG